VKPRIAMATHVSYDEYVIPELVAEVRTHWNGPFAFGAPDMVVVNMTKDRIWVRDGVVSKYPNMAPPRFDMAPNGGLVVPAPQNRRQDVQEQSIRHAEIPPDRYYPKGYQPDMLPFWPSDKPIFLPENMVPEQMKKKGKRSNDVVVDTSGGVGRARPGGARVQCPARMDGAGRLL
jgi:ribonuclease Z